MYMHDLKKDIYVVNYFCDSLFSCENKMLAKSIFLVNY